MLDKRRIYQVAKEKKLSSDALISTLKEMGYEVRSHMSVVTDEMLTAIVSKIEEEKKSSREEVKRQKTKEVDRKKPDAPAKTRPASTSQGGGQGAERPARRPAARSGRGGGRSGGSGGPPPVKEGGARRGGRRRDKRVDIPIADKIDERGGKKDSGLPMPGSEKGGRGRSGGARGRRRRSVDTQAVQENVRKTLSQLNEGRTRRRYDRSQRDEDGSEEVRILTVGEFVTVGELADHMNARPNEVIQACLGLGVMATINQRLDMDTITTLADEFGFEVKPLEAQEALEQEEWEEEEGGDPEPRSPVVTVMGHVDHGKTSLLDYLRKTNVVSGESGGITQHIGAYGVTTPDGRNITFLDTPGHAAFTAMRARGARVTDLVILVVAADDQVMPQTIEAIDHAKAAQVPIVVAINKVDLPTADPERIRRQLSEQNVLVEGWGGNVSCHEISALKGDGVDHLLELVLLEADLLELKADPNKRARGAIVEAQLDKGRGAVATVLVQEGTLRKGDSFVTGIHHGRVRALLNDHGERVDEAGPSVPVQVLGFGDVPQAGDTFGVMPRERDAKALSQKRQLLKREQDHRQFGSVTLSDLHYQIQEGKIKDLKVIVKGDVDGSVEAINQELGSITHEEVRVFVIHSGVGAISESDVLLAAASQAIIIGFNVLFEGAARSMADDNGVEIRTYEIIYEIMDDIRAGLTGLLAPSIEEKVIGQAQVREVFRSSRLGTVAGCMIQSGKVTRNNRARVRRDSEIIFEGSISSLRRFKDDVREVLEGFECGIGLEGLDDIQNEDMIEILEVVETARTL
ncbi:MAG: translation initiation factor IF-2 [Candidatus Latescibacteria bacterium]|nr:translation initiation factor IF-2 [Candidatus Latescibacterota bacterium]